MLHYNNVHFHSDTQHKQLWIHIRSEEAARHSTVEILYLEKRHGREAAAGKKKDLSGRMWSRNSDIIVP